MTSQETSQENILYYAKTSQENKSIYKKILKN